MAVQLNEQTEVTVPLKTLISIVSALLIASWYVFTTQSRIADLEHSIKLSNERFATYTQQPGREQLQVELLKKDVDHLQQQINELKQKGK